MIPLLHMVLTKITRVVLGWAGMLGPSQFHSQGWRLSRMAGKAKLMLDCQLEHLPMAFSVCVLSSQSSYMVAQGPHRVSRGRKWGNYQSFKVWAQKLGESYLVKAVTGATQIQKGHRPTSQREEYQIICNHPQFTTPLPVTVSSWVSVAIWLVSLLIPESNSEDVLRPFWYQLF